MDTPNEKQEFLNALFPPALIKKLPSQKKLKLSASKYTYEIDVTDEKKDMKMDVHGFESDEIDFRVSFGPVKLAREPWPKEPAPRWYVYEKFSNSLAFAEKDMGPCILGFLFLLVTLGKRETLKQVRDNRRYLRERKRNK